MTPQDLAKWLTSSAGQNMQVQHYAGSGGAESAPGAGAYDYITGPDGQQYVINSIGGAGGAEAAPTDWQTAAPGSQTQFSGAAGGYYGSEADGNPGAKGQTMSGLTYNPDGTVSYNGQSNAVIGNDESNWGLWRPIAETAAVAAGGYGAGAALTGEAAGGAAGGAAGAADAGAAGTAGGAAAGTGAAGTTAGLTDAAYTTGTAGTALDGTAAAAGDAAGTAAGTAPAASTGLFGVSPSTALAAGAVASSVLNKPSTPATPDYTSAAERTAQVQAQNDAAQTAANRYDQNTPTGTRTWTQDPATGKWTMTDALSENQAKILKQNEDLALGTANTQKNLLNNVDATYSKPFAGGSDAARQQTIDSQYNTMASRLDPQWKQATGSFEQTMANQGIQAGSEAYDNARRDFGYQQNDAYMNARNSAVQMGNNEFDRSFNRDLTTYKLPMDLLSASKANTPVSNPNYNAQNVSATNTQAPNYSNAAQQNYNAQLNTTNANNAYNSNLTSGLFGIASNYAYRGQ